MDPQEGRVFRFASDFGEGTRVAVEATTEHAGWGHSVVDENERLQVVREEILEDSSIDEAMPLAAPPTAQSHRVGRKEGLSPRRRTLSIIDVPQETDRELERRRDYYLEQAAELESRSKIHMMCFGVRLAGVLGMKNRIIRKSAFFPPTPPSYTFIKLPANATNALMAPPNSSDKILVEECYLFLKKASPPDLGMPQNVLTPAPASRSVMKSCSPAPATAPAAPESERTPPRESDGAILQNLPSAKLRVAAFLLRRISDGDSVTAAVLVYKPILKSEAVCDEDREDMLTDIQLRPLIIFSHGNSTDIGYDLFSLTQLSTRLHVNVLSYDYPEYGLSRAGKLTERTLLKSFKVVYDFARTRLKVPRTMILIYGQSVGSVPTSYAASLPNQFPCCAIILHSPLASALRILLTTNKDYLTRSDIFDNNQRIRNCPWPLLILHGCRDQEIPVWHACRIDKTAKSYDLASPVAKQLFQDLVLNHIASLNDDVVTKKTVADHWASRVTLWLPEFAGHNNIEILYKQEYFKRLRKFIAEHAGRIVFSKK